MIQNIQMVDLKSQYLKIKDEIDKAIQKVVDTTAFINGPQVAEFARSLEKYLHVKHVVTCANGTDAIQIALMALDLKLGDEVIVPAFTYVATAEVIGLLQLVPVMVDVDPLSYNINTDEIEKAITAKTKAIIPVHLYGQCGRMETIMQIAEKHNLFVIEDTAQATGADYIFSNGLSSKAGTVGHIGCTSFFPSKNLGCFGDGGAVYTNDSVLAEKVRMIANHGQNKKYSHKYIGCNSRLDSLQAAILNIKLKHLNTYSQERRSAADRYDELLTGVSGLQTPVRMAESTHVFHQYTLRVKHDKRNELQEYLNNANIPSMIYYPMPLPEQEAFKDLGYKIGDLPVTYQLCREVLSLPMHSELKFEDQVFITERIKAFFK